MAKVTNRIKEVLKEKGKTQLELAEYLNKEFVTISRYVNNHRQPSLETLGKISKWLKVDICDLINE